MFTLTLVDLNMKPEFLFWEFKKLIDLKWYFCLNVTSLHDQIHKTQMKLRLLKNC